MVGREMSELIVIGDRVLVSPSEGEQKTPSGLVLPASVTEKDRVAGGVVVKVGPGYVVPNPDYSEESWKQSADAVRYLPLQARGGDYAFFLRKDAVEISYDQKIYLIVPHNSILALVRHGVDDIIKDISAQ